jgi:mono/diheme cytochrome c family protein
MISAVGCDIPVATFKPNLVYAKRMEKENDQDVTSAVADATLALEQLFGTPDEPRWPAVLLEDEALASLVSLERLQRAAGAVRSDEAGVHFGLFREHCVHCHGTTGNGVGPTATFLNPYPRDFRMGMFKFKTTPRGKKPSRADIARILREGIIGTSMPSFRLVKGEDLEALVDYVIYLSIRGEVERKLLTTAAMDLDLAEGERLLDVSLKDSAPDTYAEQLEAIHEAVVDVAESWADAADQVMEVVPPADDYPLFPRDLGGSTEARERLAESVAHGREIFHGAVANCATCHGNTALGDGQVNDFDEWTKDWTVRAGIDPKNREQVSPMLQLGALKPRNIAPRNLRSGIYRGGGQPVDLYFRIVHGIDGTPMPAVPMQPDNPLGLTEEEVWDVVNYLLSLPHESISNSAANVPPFARENP